ncbi:MAG: MliC family protein [Vicinamibacterales bacterium]
MRTILVSGIPAMILAAGLAATAATPATQTGPAFDCQKAQGEVETLICRDAALAALDRKLDAVYKAATAKARDDMPARLRAEQRGWISGRNECWKAADGTFLTASWQAHSVRECVEGQYKLRISELQAVWRLVPSRGPVFFVCGSPANEVVATFFESELPAVRLERGDRSVTAWLVPAGSGAKYEGQNVEFWNKGDDATVTWLDESLTCRVR